MKVTHDRGGWRVARQGPVMGGCLHCFPLLGAIGIVTANHRHTENEREKYNHGHLPRERANTVERLSLRVFQGALEAVEGVVRRGFGLEIRVGSEGGEAGVRGAWALILAGGLSGECPASPAPSGLMYLPDVCIPAQSPRRAMPGQRTPTEP